MVDEDLRQGHKDTRDVVVDVLRERFLERTSHVEDDELPRYHRNVTSCTLHDDSFIMYSTPE